jgi:hypothetical protein
MLRMKPELESMVEDNEASPLALAAEQYATVSKYAGAFLQAFTFQSARRHDPLLAAISLLRLLYAERRRTLPDRAPVTHLSQADRRLILGQERPDRRLYADFFTHVRTGDGPRNVSAMLAGVLADATNLGPKELALIRLTG